MKLVPVLLAGLAAEHCRCGEELFSDSVGFFFFEESA